MWCSLPRERDALEKNEYHCLGAMEKASEALQPLSQRTLVAAQDRGPKSVPRPKFVENKWPGASWKHHSPHTGRAAILLSQLLLIVDNFWIQVTGWSGIFKYFLSPVFIAAWWLKRWVRAPSSGGPDWCLEPSPLQGALCPMEHGGRPSA